MAIKIIKFDLPINGTKVTTLDELRDNLTDEIVALARSGQLERWFKSRQLPEQAQAVASAVSQNAANKALFLALCTVLDVEVHPDDVNAIFDAPPGAGRRLKGRKSHEVMQEKQKNPWDSKIMEVKLPKSIGDSGFIDRWLVEKGEKVIAGQILVLVEASKGNFKITAPISGVVIEILLKNKSSISENELISIIYSLDN